MGILSPGFMGAQMRMQPAQGGGLGNYVDRLFGAGRGSGLASLLDPSIGLPMAAELMTARTTAEGIGNAFRVAGQGTRRNRTLTYLRKHHPDLAEMVESGVPISDAFDLAVLDRKTRAQKPEYGLTPQYGIDEKTGDPVLIQVGKDGSSVRTPLPSGVQLSKQPLKMDAGTHFILLDPITRQQIGAVPKDLEGAEAAKVRGKQTGEAQMDLGGAITKADQGISLIDSLIQHPGRETGTGLSSWIDPRNYIAGTDATDFNVMNRQLAGKAFLEAFESLKGGGHITEIEGQKATEAIARLDTAQSDQAYVAALNELKQILAIGKQRAYARASGGGSVGVQQPSGNLKQKYGLE